MRVPSRFSLLCNGTNISAFLREVTDLIVKSSFQGLGTASFHYSAYLKSLIINTKAFVFFVTSVAN